MNTKNQTESTESMGAPRSNALEAIAGLWREVLPGRDIGPDSDFFDLGGTPEIAGLLAQKISGSLGKKSIPWRSATHPPSPA